MNSQSTLKVIALIATMVLMCIVLTAIADVVIEYMAVGMIGILCVCVPLGVVAFVADIIKIIKR